MTGICQEKEWLLWLGSNDCRSAYVGLLRRPNA